MTSANNEGHEQLQDILRRLERMEQRLNDLQAQVGQGSVRPTPPPPPPPLPTARPTPPPVVAPPKPEPAPKPPPEPFRLAPLPEPDTPSTPTPRPVSRPTPVTPRPAPPVTPAGPVTPVPPMPILAPKPALPENWETEIALKWMGRIGIAALFFGIAFFLQYAFRNGWINEAGQVAIGLVVGLALVLGGWANRREERRAFSEALMGGGLAILYLSVYASYAVYSLLEHLQAFSAMGIITLLGALVALRTESQVTAILTTVGGFLTPLVLHKTGGADATPAEQYSTLLQLFGYITILNLGLLGLSVVRQWRSLQLLSFVGSWLIMWGWIGELHGTALNFSTATAMAVMFALYLLVPVVRNLWLRQQSRETDIILILANPSFFFTTTVLLLWHLREYLGVYAVAMGLLYFAVGYLGRRRSPEDRLVFMSWLGLAIGFMVVAVPLQFEGHWIMIGWGLEAAVLVWVGHGLRSLSLRGVGLAMLTIVFGWLLLLYTLEEGDLPSTAAPFLNPLFLSYLGGMGTLAVALLLYLYAKPEAEEKFQAVNALTFGLAGLALWGATVEMLRCHMPSHTIMLYWGVEGAFLVWLGHCLRSVGIRGMGMVVQTVVFGWLLMLYQTDHQQAHMELPFVNPLFLSYLGGTLLLGVSLLIYRYEPREAEEKSQTVNVLIYALAVLALWGVTVEMLRSQWSSHTVMLYWGVEGAFLVWLGHRLRNVGIRGMGMVVQTVVFGWLLVLYPLEKSHVAAAAPPFLNSLFLSYLGGTALLGLSRQLYVSARPEAEEREAIVQGLNFTLPALLLWGVTAEMLRLHWASQFVMLWWAAGSLAMLQLGLARLGKGFVYCGLALQGVVAVWLLTLYSDLPQAPVLPLANSIFLSFVLGVLSLGAGLWLLLRHQQTRADQPWLLPVFVVALSFLSVWGLTAETLRSTQILHTYAGVAGFAVSILWCLCAGALIGIGMVIRTPLPRQLGVILFGVAIAKVFLYDSSALDTIWRVLSFVCLGVILIAVSYLYHLYRERVQEFIGGGRGEE